MGPGQVGRALKLLKEAGCDSVVIAGYVKRPDFSKLKLDVTGAKLLPKIIAAARKGDDALLGVLVATFEAHGFRVIGSETIFAELLAGEGCFGAVEPDDGTADPHEPTPAPPTSSYSSPAQPQPSTPRTEPGSMPSSSVRIRPPPHSHRRSPPSNPCPN